MTAEGGYLAANSFFVEIVSLRAFGTNILIPGLAAVMIGYSDNITEGDTGVGGVEAAEIS